MGFFYSILIVEFNMKIKRYLMLVATEFIVHQTYQYV